jgi:LuxR family maltose regulon positive regulatory protein
VGDLRSEPGSAPASRDGPLLRRKITVPSVPGRVVARARLFRRLSAGVQLPLTTVLASAGWGKTLLLCSWLNAAPPPGSAAWLSLDSADNDPVRFWAYVLAALRIGCDLPADHPIAAMRPSRDAAQDPDGFLALLVNALGELDKPIILILDDVHEILAPDVTHGVAFLLAHAPPQLRVLMSGRFMPQVPLGRMRVAGEVSEIRASELGFTEDEVVELFSGAGLEVPRQTLRALCERAEGWPAGIRLAELSMQGAADPSSAIADFSGDLRAVADYLMSEVFTRQDQDVCDFLLRTCVCEQLTGDLANALTGRSDSAHVLDGMERTNAFIVAQGRRPWYRYHQLFAEMLRHKLGQESPNAIVDLHRTAASWYSANELPVDAVHHAIAARDWDMVGTVMSEAWLKLFLDGEITTLRRLLAQIPETVLRADAEFSVIRAATNLAVDDRGAAEDDIDRAEHIADHLPASRKPPFALAMAMVRLDQARLAGDVSMARAAAARLLAADEPKSTERGGIGSDVRALAQLNLGVTEYFTGDRGAAESCLREGLALARKAGRDYVVLGCLSQLTVVLTAQNRPTEAAHAAEEAVELADRRGWSETLQMAETWHALGWIHYLWNQLDAAELYLDRAEEAVRASDVAIRGSIRMVQGLVLSLRGDRLGALAMLEAAAEDLRAVMDRYVFSSYVRAEPIRLLISGGQLDRARALLGQNIAGQRPAHLLVAQAELQLADGDPSGALETLAPAVSCSAAGFLDQWLQAQVLSAVVLNQLGEEAAAWQRLEEALNLAEPEGYRQPFLQIGLPARTLISRHTTRRSKHRTFVNDLLACFPLSVPPSARKTSSSEALTDREIDVLRCLREMMTAPEIAAELFLSVNTVKAHLKHIYRKLGVSSRRQAVARGSELGLVG